MKNKKIWLGILVVFGLCVSGCTTSPSVNFYNLGDVSEENCALIQVSPVLQVIDQINGTWTLLESDYSHLDLVKIDGAGDGKQWQAPAPGPLDPFPKRAIVRVTPGVHTFTIRFIDSEDADYYYLVPLDITYDCKAGKGYVFRILVREKNDLTALSSANAGIRLGIVTTTITIEETKINENGDPARTGTEVGKKTETLTLNTAFNPNDSGRVVRVPKN